MFQMLRKDENKYHNFLLENLRALKGSSEKETRQRQRWSAWRRWIPWGEGAGRGTGRRLRPDGMRRLRTLGKPRFRVRDLSTAYSVGRIGKNRETPTSVAYAVKCTSSISHVRSCIPEGPDPEAQVWWVLRNISPAIPGRHVHGRDVPDVSVNSPTTEAPWSCQCNIEPDACARRRGPEV